MLSTTLLEVVLYLFVDGFYPAEMKLWTGWDGLAERVLRIAGNHLLMR